MGMQLSQRVLNLKPSATLEVSARAKAMRAAGADVIGFGAGEPDFDTPMFLKEVAAKALDDGWTKYVAAAGDPGAREAIAKRLRDENGLSGATAEGVVITTGGKMALYLAIQSLVDPGQEVVFQTPAWVSYGPIAELAGAKLVEVPTTPEMGFRMSAADLAGALTATSRVLIFNSPSNPTGVVYSADELKGLAEVVNTHNRAQRAAGLFELVVFCDEIYEKLIYGDEAGEEVEFASLAPFIEGDGWVVLNGLSKAYAMTGWRIGYAAMGSTVLAKAMAKMHVQTCTSITACCYPVIAEAFAHGGAEVARMRRAYAGRLKLMYELVCDLPSVTCVRPSGAFYVFPDVSAYFGKTSAGGRKITDAVGFADALLVEAEVAVVPGNDFGGCGANHIRLSYACSEETIREGLARVRLFLEGIA